LLSASAAIQADSAKKINKSYTLRLGTEEPSIGPASQRTSRDLEQTITILEKRLNSLGVKNLLVQSQGNDRVVVKVSGITETTAEQIHATLTQPAKLELKLVHPDNRKLANKVAADPKNKLIPGYELKVLKDTDDDGKATSENILVKKRASIDGSSIMHAQELYGPYEGQLDVELNAEGAAKMFKVTKKMHHGRDRLAIVLDGKVLSAPVVQSTLSKKFQISGMGGAKEAKALAATLLNPLKIPLILEKEESFTPPLAK